MKGLNANVWWFVGGLFVTGLNVNVWRLFVTGLKVNVRRFGGGLFVAGLNFECERTATGFVTGLKTTRSLIGRSFFVIVSKHDRLGFESASTHLSDTFACPAVCPTQKLIHPNSHPVHSVTQPLHQALTHPLHLMEHCTTTTPMGVQSSQVSDMDVETKASEEHVRRVLLVCSDHLTPATLSHLYDRTRKWEDKGYSVTVTSVGSERNNLFAQRKNDTFLHAAICAGEQHLIGVCAQVPFFGDRSNNLAVALSNAIQSTGDTRVLRSTVPLRWSIDGHRVELFGPKKIDTSRRLRQALDEWSVNAHTAPSVAASAREAAKRITKLVEMVDAVRDRLRATLAQQKGQPLPTTDSGELVATPINKDEYLAHLVDSAPKEYGWTMDKLTSTVWLDYNGRLPELFGVQPDLLANIKLCGLLSEFKNLYKLFAMFSVNAISYDLLVMATLAFSDPRDWEQWRFPTPGPDDPVCQDDSARASERMRTALQLLEEVTAQPVARWPALAPAVAHFERVECFGDFEPDDLNLVGLVRLLWGYQKVSVTQHVPTEATMDDAIRDMAKDDRSYSLSLRWAWSQLQNRAMTSDMLLVSNPLSCNAKAVLECARNHFAKP